MIFFPSKLGGTCVCVCGGDFCVSVCRPASGRKKRHALWRALKEEAWKMIQ